MREKNIKEVSNNFKDEFYNFLIELLSNHGGFKMYSKRIVGPIPNMFKGDTIKIYSQTYFDCGNFSEQKRDSLSVIII